MISLTGEMPFELRMDPNLMMINSIVDNGGGDNGSGDNGGGDNGGGENGSGENGGGDNGGGDSGGGNNGGGNTPAPVITNPDGSVANILPAGCTEMLNPPELSRSYSAVFGNDAPGTGRARSMLNSIRAWAAPNPVPENSWVIIDAEKEESIGGVAIQKHYYYTG